MDILKLWFINIKTMETAEFHSNLLVLESIQYYKALAITGAIRGSSRRKRFIKN